MAYAQPRLTRPLTDPGTRRVRLALAAALRAARAVLRPHAVSLAKLLDMPFAVIGTGCIDFAAFHYVHMIGWAVTGVSLWLWNEILADDDSPPGRT